nr:adenylate kinase [Rickettsiaceae bacterium]
EKCGAIYNKFLAPTKVENICDVCGAGKFSYRVDDNEVTIRKRLDVYEKETLPIIEYYKNLNLLHCVDAMKQVDEIKEELLSILKKR